ncbi:CPBP family intramembrane glutamic endopeptidase [Halogeometricum luteum]|uniref:CPBP family intramembrane metalloprotease n=1 Tax=Halogeometricum luteum TaxID=2950537 RepID=A0ABU2G0E0_9EURY|nr:type II CAAX endopeptidase family protein [Halogeometricum sp. S3BR5-2]MDS0293709.1 CPBP family intramembrane metalloprotease [Halogeometricum sp. S3BR5-2]
MSTHYPTPETDAPRDGRAARAVLVAVGLFALGVLANLVFSVAVAVPLFLAGVGITSAAALVLLTLAGQLGFAAVAVGYLRRWLSGVPVRRLTRSDARVVGVSTVAVLLVAFGFTALSAVLPIEPTTSVVGDVAASEPWVLLAFAALSILVVAPAEELLFRGAVQGRLRRAFGPAAAVVGAGALFAVLHVLNFGVLNAGAAVALGVIFLVGALLGWAYERTGNLLVPVAVHGVYNAVLFGASYLTYALA